MLTVNLVRSEPIRIDSQISATLDFLRWVSAFLVLTGHVRAMFFPPYEKLLSADILTKVFYLITGFGHQAVMVFFVLSGFLGPFVIPCGT